jgi:hypothetical protein
VWARIGNPLSGLSNAVPKTRSKASSAIDEVRVRLEAASANSAYALLGELDSDAALEGTVRLLERAALHIRLLEEGVA